MTAPTYKDYTVNFDPTAIPELYSDWDWLIDQKYLNNPWLMTSFGDLFFVGPDASVHFIDTLEGTITPFAENVEAAQEKLSNADVQRHYLASDTVEILKERNLILKDDELYIYVPHPIVAGKVNIDSIKVYSAKIAISLCGQLLRQMRV